jgi:hypothetical protein
MNKTIFIAAMLAVATVLAAGLAVLPGSVQEAQANPCSVNEDGDGADTLTTGDQECNFIGPIEIEE